MDLTNIAITPYTEGYIKVAFETDPAVTAEARTKPEFRVTARHHEGNAQFGTGVPALAKHPITEKLQQPDAITGEKVVREIPIKLFFNKADRAISISYQAFSAELGKQSVPVCNGNGKDAQRLIRAADDTVSQQQVACPGPERCQLVLSGLANCNRQVRMAVHIDGQDDPLSVFEVRTTSLNTYRAIKSQLLQLEKAMGGLRHVPLKLSLWQASNSASNYEPFDLMRLGLNAPSLIEASKARKAVLQELETAGVSDDMDTALGATEPATDIELGIPTLDFQGMAEVYDAPAPRRSAVSPALRGGVPAGYAQSLLDRNLQRGAVTGDTEEVPPTVAGVGDNFADVPA